MIHFQNNESISLNLHNPMNKTTGRIAQAILNIDLRCLTVCVFSTFLTHLKAFGSRVSFSDHFPPLSVNFLQLCPILLKLQRNDPCMILHKINAKLTLTQLKTRLPDQIM